MNFINIMYCGDANIAKGLTMSIMSLLQNTKEEMHIYIITAEIKLSEKTYMPLTRLISDRLEGYAKSYNKNNTVTLIDVSDHFRKQPAKANLKTRFTPLCMLRLYADEIEEIPDKLLYLDCDVICRKNFSPFYHTDIEAYELAGVLDRYGKWFFKNSIFKPDYINSGVLLLNMKRIRQTGLFKKCRIMCAEKKMFMPDQSAINKLASNKLLVDRIYNEQKLEGSLTVFRHFTTTLKFFPKFKAITVKPWDMKKMHEIMANYEYDRLYAECENFLKNTGDTI